MSPSPLSIAWCAPEAESSLTLILSGFLQSSPRFQQNCPNRCCGCPLGEPLRRTHCCWTHYHCCSVQDAQGAWNNPLPSGRRGYPTMTFPVRCSESATSSARSCARRALSAASLACAGTSRTRFALFRSFHRVARAILCRSPPQRLAVDLQDRAVAQW